MDRIVKMDLKEIGLYRAWLGFIRLEITANGGIGP
jgi:hypothetical protein